MAKQYPEITASLHDFIVRQQVFFVATAAGEGRVNLSPKGMDTLRILSPGRIVWLNLTGSGNETAAHLRVSDRMTIMFCAFAGDPVILRLYGHARVLHPRDAQWGELAGMFPPLPGARQVIDMTVDLVQTSCGMGVPLYEYAGDRDALNGWAERKGEEGVRKYWSERNLHSIDGRPTGIFED